MASTPITAQTATAVGPLRSLTESATPKSPSKSDFAGNISRFFESRKIKFLKNPPTPPARITKAVAGISAALDGADKKHLASCPTDPGAFYDDAWDIRLVNFGLHTSQSQPTCLQPTFTPNQQQKQSQRGICGRGLPDGGVMLEGSPNPSSAVEARCSEVANDATSTTTAANSSDGISKMAPSSNDQSKADSSAAVVTPTTSNNWFPPPPPSPLHHVVFDDNEPVVESSERYHEHRRSFELDDDDDDHVIARVQTNDVPELSSPSDPTGSSSFAGGGGGGGGSGNARVTTCLLDLPTPPPVASLLAEVPTTFSTIAPKESKTAITLSVSTQVTDLDTHQQPIPEPPPPSMSNESSQLEITQPRCADGRSVVPWERSMTTSSTAVDLSGSLPQWVPPQRSGAAISTRQRDSQSIRHPSSSSSSKLETPRSGRGGPGDVGAPRPVSLTVGGRSDPHHRRGRQQRSSHSFGEDVVTHPQTNSDHSWMPNSRAIVVTEGVWPAAIPSRGLDSDSVGQFVPTNCETRQYAGSHSSAHRQRSMVANQRQALAAVANVDMMTQSLIDWSGFNDNSPSSSLPQQCHQDRICPRMKTAHLSDSAGLVLSSQDAASLPVYHQGGRRVFITSSSSSNKTSPVDAPTSGYFFRNQLSYPPHLGGKIRLDEAVWAEGGGRMLGYQTAPTQAYPGQGYMMWPPHQFIAERRRRHHHLTNHHSTQPIIVPSADDVASSTHAGHNAPRPQVLVTGPQRSKRAADLAALVALPVEKQPWFHGRLPRIEAESLLRSAPPGSFLVRTSETSKEAFSLSIRRDRDFLHMKISYDLQSEAYILGEYSQPYATVPIMVHHYTRNLLPVRGTKPVLLKYPLCRSVNPFGLHRP